MIERARNDLRRIVSGYWGESLTFENPARTEIASIKGLASSHHLSYDPETNVPINVRNTHITVYEKDLTDAGYTVRNAAGEVSLRRHYVTYTNSAGQERTYRIDETMPDETLGAIICILGDYVEN